MKDTTKKLLEELFRTVNHRLDAQLEKLEKLERLTQNINCYLKIQKEEE